MKGVWSQIPKGNLGVRLGLRVDELGERVLRLEADRQRRVEVEEDSV